MTEDVTLRDNPDQSRYELHVGSQRVGIADYYERGTQTVIPHTEINPAFGGRGLGGRLVRFALDDIRAKGHTVVPSCPFVGDFIAKNPSYADML